jgi:hypothetical protein
MRTENLHKNISCHHPRSCVLLLNHASVCSGMTATHGGDLQLEETSLKNSNLPCSLRTILCACPATATTNDHRCMHCVVMCEEFGRSDGRRQEFWNQAGDPEKAWEGCWKPEKSDSSCIVACVVAVRVRGEHFIVGQTNFWLYEFEKPTLDWNPA